MTFKQSLSSIIAAGALAIGIAGCATNQTSYQDHNYSTRIGQDSVSFLCTETTSMIFTADKPNKTFQNIMTIYKPDGRVILLWDKEASDLYVDSVNVRVPLTFSTPQKNTNWLTGESNTMDNELAQSEAPNFGYTEKSYSRKNTLDGKVMEAAQKSFNDLYKKLEEKKVAEGINLLK